jgi:hypothetical protein
VVVVGVVAGCALEGPAAGQGAGRRQSEARRQRLRRTSAFNFIGISF